MDASVSFIFYQEILEAKIWDEEAPLLSVFQSVCLSEEKTNAKKWSNLSVSVDQHPRSDTILMKLVKKINVY